MPKELLELKHACDAIEIPSGQPHLLPAGTRVKVTQNLGDSYTVMTELGHMLRIAGKDADALGVAPPQPAESTVSEFSEKLVWDQLKNIYDPEIPINVVDLGLIYSCQITPAEVGYKIDVKMSLTAPGCGMANVLRVDVERQTGKAAARQRSLRRSGIRSALAAEPHVLLPKLPIYGQMISLKSRSRGA